MLKNYFHMAGVTVANSIWMDQMVICPLFSAAGWVYGADWLHYPCKGLPGRGEENPVACGVSGAYEGMERLTEAYGEAASFIREYFCAGGSPCL